MRRALARALARANDYASASDCAEFRAGRPNNARAGNPEVLAVLERAPARVRDFARDMTRAVKRPDYALPQEESAWEPVLERAPARVLDSRQWLPLPQIEPDPVLARACEVAMYRQRIEVLKGPSAPMPPDNRLLHAPVKARSIRKRPSASKPKGTGRAPAIGRYAKTMRSERTININSRQWGF
jgi:hypothetical protein